MTAVPADEEFIFNIVWTGKVFPFLRYFVSSQIAHSNARFRFLANGCSPEQIPMMEEFREQHPGRVLEVLKTRDDMGAHGVALDVCMEQRDDGKYFCFIDPDILARGPFVQEFAKHLVNGCDGVTSGKGVWIDDPTIPVDQAGVSGEYFYAQNGYLFGSPHFAMYHRDAIDKTFSEWGVSFRSAVVGRLPQKTQDVIDAIEQRYWLYDTGKIANIVFQENGYKLCHFESDRIMHIGGMSHYLSPPSGGGAAEDANWQPNEHEWTWPVTRLEVAAYTAKVLRNLVEGRDPPDVPTEVDADIAPRLQMVRDELITLVTTYK